MKWVGMVGHHACMEEVTFCEIVQWVVHPWIWREITKSWPSPFYKGKFTKKLTFSHILREWCRPAHMKGSFFVISLRRGKRGLPYTPASWEGILEMKWLLAEALTLLCIAEESENRPFWI
jgi:hypothetical protein